VPITLAERIIVVADQEGGTTLSFKDRRTYVGARLYLGGHPKPAINGQLKTGHFE
jgi:hypothetical protein